MDIKTKLDVLFVSAECIPFCANGGVADMCYALPKYLNKTDKVNVRVILPLYSKIPEKYRNGFRLIAERTVELSWRKEYCGVYEYEFNGITYYFIDNKQYFDRENLFGYTDDVERFSFFSKAVLDILPIVNFFPDIIHTNDWQSSMVCTFLKILEWQNSKYEHIKTLLNIHNLNYQGLAEFNIVKDLLNVDDKFLYLFDYFGKANIMKASIMCADRIVAVSETYKDEIMNSDKGMGLQGVLESVSYKVSGIINGIDYEYYNPATDPIIYAQYDKDNIEKRLENKLKLQEELGLEVNADIPVYAYVGYMGPHKGIDLLRQVIEKYLGTGKIQLVGIGGGSPEYQNYMKYLNEKFPANSKIKFGYDNHFVKKIYAGADFLFNISSIEPCGLCPLIANKYGCLPIVYETGGLKDNFTDFRYQGGNGYTFNDYDANTLSDLIDRTLRHFENKERINGYVAQVMNESFDIKDCADKYIKVYEEM